MPHTLAVIRRLVPIAIGAVILLTVGGASSAARTAFEVVGDDAPAWSPDGSEIAFTSFRNGKGDIYVMHPDGTGLRRLTTSPAHDDLAAWSPDGTRIAFTSTRSGDLEIWVMNADGSDQHQLTFDRSNDYSPTWSPDGTRIAYRSDKDGDADIYSMRADGSDVRRLTTAHSTDYSPAWGPDGRILFVSDRNSGGKQTLWIMNGDGSDQHPLTGAAFFWNQTRPAWSPDGKRIIFQADRDVPIGNTELYSMNVDTSDLRRLTTYPGKDDWPSYSPDGKHLVFARGQTPYSSEVYVMSVDGTDVHELTLPRLRPVRFLMSPRRPVAGAVLIAAFDVIEQSGANTVRTSTSCSAKAGVRPLKLRTRTFDESAGRAQCSWLVPKNARGLTLNGVITVTGPQGPVSHRFTFRVS